MRFPAMGHSDLPPELNELTGKILEACFEVHTELGPGLLERVYRLCVADLLRERGHEVLEEVAAPVVFRGRRIEGGYRIDLLVDRRVVVEVKAVEEIHPVHPAQVFTYLKMTGAPVGLLVNFKTKRLRTGIRRIVRS